MAWFEYLRCRPGFLRVGLGEFQLASLPSVSPSQTVRLPRARRPRLVLPPIPDTVGLLDVLPLGALETRHAGPRISGWRAIIDRDRELCTKAFFRYKSIVGDLSSSTHVPRGIGVTPRHRRGNVLEPDWASVVQQQPSRTTSVGDGHVGVHLRIGEPASAHRRPVRSQRRQRDLGLEAAKGCASSVSKDVMVCRRSSPPSCRVTRGWVSGNTSALVCVVQKTSRPLHVSIAHGTFHPTQRPRISQTQLSLDQANLGSDAVSPSFRGVGRGAVLDRE